MFSIYKDLYEANSPKEYISVNFTGLDKAWIGWSISLTLQITGVSYKWFPSVAGLPNLYSGIDV